MKNIFFAFAFVLGALVGLPCLVQAAPAPSGEPLEISASGTFEWHRDAHQYVARGDVVARQGEMTLTADELVAEYHDSTDGGGPQIDRLTATGHVTIKTATETATGTRAVYNQNDQTALLEGPVTITRGPNVLTGAAARVNLKTGTSTLVGGGGKNRVTGVFYTAPKQ